jgi:NADPH-dependent glutamate synthase beta subunit-like oxidoreductase
MSSEVDVPGYLRLIARRPVEAYKLILEVPFPGILGRVCMHPAEPVPKEVNSLLRSALKDMQQTGLTEPSGGSSSGKHGHKVAVIGAGPAELSASFYLKKGTVTSLIHAKPGGMMRYGSLFTGCLKMCWKRDRPDPDTGIKLETNKTLGKDFTLEDLKTQGFEAMFIATGLQAEK